MLRATCTCTSVAAIRAGVVVCLACGAPVVADERDDGGEVSTLRLPLDVKDDESGRDTFNRACRSGRVKGARKVGRVWICSREAWAARATAPVPRGLPATAKPLAKAKATELPTVSEDLLARLGGRFA